ncbi:MAG TPA: regulatory protein RecX [Patescibacteria group bacterium]|nr:regulatory protein RecX [Patescibacteria group bacterium]
MDLSERARKYLENVYRFLTIRNRSEKEVRDYLIKKKAEAEIVEHIIALLQQQKFLDDEAFARGWVTSRARFRPKGKSALQFELQQKGVAKELIEKILNEEHEDIPDELTQAKNLIERRIEKLKDAPRQEIYAKVGGFLARRGYKWDTIKRSIDEVLRNRV